MSLTPPRAWLILWVCSGWSRWLSSPVFSDQTHQARLAYLDVGSDRYGQVLPDTMHMARKLASQGFTGWSLVVDGQSTPLQRANFGVPVAPVQTCNHKMALDFELPGRRAGGWLGALGLGLLALVVVITRRRRASAQVEAVS